MEGDIPVEPLEEGNSLANQDRQNRITHFVCQPETQAIAADCTAPNDPDATERRPQAAIHELRKIAGVELDRIAPSRQSTAGQDEDGFVAVRPPEPFGFEIQG